MRIPERLDFPGHDIPAVKALREEIGDSRVAIAHEWLAARAGSEKVFEAIASVLPNADLFALSAAPHVEMNVGDREIATTALDAALLRERRALTLPIMPLAWQRFRDRNFDLVITSSHAFAKAFPGARRATHLDYCHTPMRYVWTPELDHRTRRFGKASRLLTAPLRWLDFKYSKRVNAFAANSREVANRIRLYYDRAATVIHPPVDVDYFSALPLVSNRARPYALAFSRFIRYKRLDLAIEACGQSGFPLIVAGHGPEEPRLRALARPFGDLVSFVIRPTDQEVRTLMRSARVLIFPAYEDFGIIPVEAQLTGTPVLAYGRGGVRDTVREGKTGHLVSAQSVSAFATGLRDFDWSSLSPSDCRSWASNFSTRQFKINFSQWALSSLRNPSL